MSSGSPAGIGRAIHHVQVVGSGVEGPGVVPAENGRIGRRIDAFPGSTMIMVSTSIILGVAQIDVT